MPMRALTIVGLKLLAIWNLCRAMEQVALISGPLMVLHTAPKNIPGFSPWWLMASVISSVAVYALLGLFLLLCADWLADKLGIPFEPLHSSVTVPEFFRMGLIILGLAIGIDALAGLTDGLYSAYQQGGSGVFHPRHEGGKYILELIFALIVILNSKRIAASAFPPEPSAL